MTPAARSRLLVSAELEDRIREGDVTLGGIPARIAAPLPAGFLPGTEGLWVLVDTAFAQQLVDGELETQRLLIGAVPVPISPPSRPR